MTISLSHRAGTAMCAVALSGTGLGCDLELIEPRSDAFIIDYLTAREQALVGANTRGGTTVAGDSAMECERERPQGAARGAPGRHNTAWMLASAIGCRRTPGTSRQDLPLVPMPDVDPDGWHPLHVRYSGEQAFSGWWRHTDHMVRTVVSSLPLRSPIGGGVSFRPPSEVGACGDMDAGQQG